MGAAEMAWFEAGLVEGIEIGRRQLEDEWRGTMQAGAEVARRVASAGPYAALCDRRGEPERAERQRHILAERGVA